MEDAAQAGAAGAEVTLSAKDGKHAIIVGKPIGEGNFVRRLGEVKSYSVAPAILVDAEPRAWIDERLIDIPATSIQSVELKPQPAQATCCAARSPRRRASRSRGSRRAARLSMPRRSRPRARHSRGLGAEDVAPASDIDFSKPTQAIFTLSDGNVLTLTGTAAGDKRWIEMQATKDAALTAKAQNRAFEVASYRYDAIFRPLDQLLVPKETKPPAGKPAAEGKSARRSKPGAASKSATPSAPAPAQ